MHEDLDWISRSNGCPTNWSNQKKPSSLPKEGSWDEGKVFLHTSIYPKVSITKISLIFGEMLVNKFYTFYTSFMIISGHWRLVGINKTNKRVYWVDPLHLPPTNELMELLKEALCHVNPEEKKPCQVFEIKVNFYPIKHYF